MAVRLPHLEWREGTRMVTPRWLLFGLLVLVLCGLRGGTRHH